MSKVYVGWKDVWIDFDLMVQGRDSMPDYSTPIERKEDKEKFPYKEGNLWFGIGGEDNCVNWLTFAEELQPLIEKLYNDWLVEKHLLR